MTPSGSFCPIVAFALRASRACQVSFQQSFKTPLTPAAAQAGYTEALPGKCWIGAVYTKLLTLPKFLGIPLSFFAPCTPTILAAPKSH